MKTLAESVPPGSRGWVLGLIRHQVEILPGRFSTLAGQVGKKRPVALETFFVAESIAFWSVAFPLALVAFPLLTVIQTTSGLFGSGGVLHCDRIGRKAGPGFNCFT